MVIPAHTAPPPQNKTVLQFMESLNECLPKKHEPTSTVVAPPPIRKTSSSTQVEFVQNMAIPRVIAVVHDRRDALSGPSCAKEWRVTFVPQQFVRAALRAVVRRKGKSKAKTSRVNPLEKVADVKYPSRSEWISEQDAIDTEKEQQRLGFPGAAYTYQYTTCRIARGDPSIPHNVYRRVVWKGFGPKDGTYMSIPDMDRQGIEPCKKESCA
jgi:hypothetical protein